MRLFCGVLAGCVLVEILTSCRAMTPVPPETIDPSPVAALNVSQTLSDFYATYVGFPGNPLNRHTYDVNPTLRQYLSDDVVKQVDQVLASFEGQGGGFDPFLCAQDRPSEFQIDVLEEEPYTARAQILTGFSGSPLEARIEVELIRVGGRWLIDSLVCQSPRSGSSEPVPISTDQQDAIGQTWKLFQHPLYAFQFAYPGSWIIGETAVQDPTGADPIEGYLVFFDDQGQQLPIAVVMSIGSEEQYRRVFPVPEMGSQTISTEPYLVLKEIYDHGETYYHIIDPSNQNLRIAFRLIHRQDNPPVEIIEIMEQMVNSVKFIEADVP